MSNYYLPIKMATIEKADSIKHGQGCVAIRVPTYCHGVCKIDNHFGKLLGFYFDFLINFFNLSIVDTQCHLSFRCTA